MNVSRREARRAQLVAQGLLGPRLLGGPSAVLARTRAVQLDTISVLARSHELVAYARLGPLDRKAIEVAYWGGPPFSAFEYWYHAACVLPIEEWPTMGFRRAERLARGRRWHRLEDSEKSCREILAALADRGPLTANELGGAKNGGPWWDWSETKIAAEWLLDTGEIVCTTRRAFQRVYDLPERALPAELYEKVVDRDSAVRRLVRLAALALGVATPADIAVYTGLKTPEVAGLLSHAAREIGLEPASVEGWKSPAVAVPEALAHPAVTGGARGRPRLISPFDPLIWHRERVERIFSFRHRLEAYVPRPKRVHGYFAMPVLAGDRLIGRVDPARDGRTLIARRAQLEPGLAVAAGARAIARALLEAASWVGADNVVVETSEPALLRAQIVAATGS
ncbi:MAG: winged helix-turn-helix domain-containing protein [Acidimicrobiales bacterium]